jgi:hypothetical protein
MPQSPSDVNQGFDNDQFAQRNRASNEADRAAFPPRKPVPNETDFHPALQTGIVRTVPKLNADSNSSEPAQERSGVGDVVPNFSRLNMGNSRNSLEAYIAASPSVGADRGAEIQTHKTIPRRSLEKPLPLPPAGEFDFDGDGHGDGDILESYDKQGFDMSNTHDLERKLGVEGQLDLSQTEDTEIQTHWAPAVTHETIIENVHEVKEEQITREIHEHDVIHRILPIEEVEVLPARHFVRDGNGALQEVSEHRIPSRVDKYVQKGVAKGLEKALSRANAAVGPRNFTAREFHGDEGDYEESFMPDGSVRSERWWVHAPMLETGGVETGQTHPFHLGSSRPEDDGWRT